MSNKQDHQTGFTPPLASQKAGFTIIELLVATTVFSLILVICAAALIYLGRTYYKGVTVSKTQSTSRTIIDDIVRPLQFTAETPTASPTAAAPTVNVFCLGNKRYSYLLDRQQNDFPSTDPAAKQARHVLWSDTMTSSSTSNCQALDLNQATPTDSASLGDGRELVPGSMRLTKFAVTSTNPTQAVYKVEVWVVYGDEDLLSPADATGSRNCKDGMVGSQFCALSEITTFVQRRLR